MKKNLKILNNKFLLSENAIQRQCINYLLSKKWAVIRFNSGAVKYGDRFVEFYKIMNNGESKGLSDLMAIKNGYAIFIETKTVKGRQCESQKEFETLCKEFGNNYYTIRDLNDLIGILDGITAINKFSEEICKQENIDADILSVANKNFWDLI